LIPAKHVGFLAITLAAPSVSTIGKLASSNPLFFRMSDSKVYLNVSGDVTGLPVPSYNNSNYALFIFCQFGLILYFKTPETCQEIYMNAHIFVGGTSVRA
jgi:hypothetical protein